MYSQYTHLNLLTQFLIQYGIQHIVVCPGSRNAPIVHNFTQSEFFITHPITDERSAGFYALGMALGLNKPVAVCVTSGSALLNLSPALSEAYYRNCPIVVISADRPHRWIDQNEGQTIRQHLALHHFVVEEINLSNTSNEDETKYLNRLCNQAFIQLNRLHKPIHFNIEIEEPLYVFNQKVLPDIQFIRYTPPQISKTTLIQVADKILQTPKVLIVIGQTNTPIPSSLIHQLKKQCGVAYEPLSVDDSGCHFEKLKTSITIDEPNLVLYGGGHLVSKSLKKYLRTLSHTEMWHITPHFEICDTFLHLSHIVEGDFMTILDYIAQQISPSTENKFAIKWNELTRPLNCPTLTEFNHEKAVALFEKYVNRTTSIIHYANSMPIRYACKWAKGFVYVNRGVNGIDGSSSTAAGHSLIVERTVYIVTGDLSFFYDNNALWNQEIGSNFRILLLNNGGGNVFNHVEGLDPTPENLQLIWAQHHTTAKGLCEQHQVKYLQADNEKDFMQYLPDFLNSACTTSILLEVNTK